MTPSQSLPLRPGEHSVLSVPASRGWLRRGQLVVTDERVAFVSRWSSSLELSLTTIERVDVLERRLTVASEEGQLTFRLRDRSSAVAVNDAIEEQALPLRRMRDDLARALERSIDMESIPPAASFDDLDQAMRDELLRVAEATAVALRRLGFTVDAAGGDSDVVRLDDGTVEGLARIEHERRTWYARVGRPPVGSLLTRREPDLGPWEALAENDRERERKAVRELPSLLAQVGLALRGQRPTGAFFPVPGPAPGAPEPMPAGPHAPGDTVECSVFSPAVVAAGQSVLVQAFAHLIEQAEKAEELAVTFDLEAQRRGVRTLGLPVPPGNRLDFELHVPRAEVDDPIQSMVWQGRPESVQFGVTAPDSAGTLVATLHVAVGGVPAGHLKFKLSVVAEGAADLTPSSEPGAEAARRYTKAFVSYASPDRANVLARVQMLRAVGIEYFQDVLDLEPGQRWERALYRHIDECDLFLLCWSERAKASEWVRKEAGRALERKGDDDTAPPEIRPVILEGPPVPEPWPELAHLHFNDRLTYLLAIEG